MINLQKIFKIYTKGDEIVHALSDVSLTVGKGDFCAITGHSGSGKTTLMNILGLLDTPTSGEYFLDGQSIIRHKKEELSVLRNKKIGFIFQGFNLVPKLTAFENVELPLIFRGMNRERRREFAMEALVKVGLAHRTTHYPSELSGGQQQRVAIARAIVTNPPIILADEPTGNLDFKSSMKIMEILTMLNEEGVTLILITHDDKIANFGKYIVNINDGKIKF